MVSSLPFSALSACREATQLTASADGCYKPPVNWNRFQSVAIRRQLEAAPEADPPSAQSSACFLRPGDAFAETTEATGTAPLVSTVHAAVGTSSIQAHGRVAYTLAANKPHGVQQRGY